MKLWTSLSPTPEGKRWEILSQQIQALGAANQFVPWEGAVKQFTDMSALDKFQHVRLSSSIGPHILQQLKVQSSWTTLLGVIDGMVKTERDWWPLCALYESFGQILIELGQGLDMRGSVFIAGAGGAARTAIAAFFKAGFRSFLVTNFDEAEAEAMIKDVSSRFFGLTIQWIPTERIVLLPGESTVLVNCTPSVEENALLVELSYLNFLKRPGFLFDMSRYLQQSILVQEAHDAGVRVIDGLDIAARTDVLWAKWAFQVDLALEKHREALASNS